MYVRGSRGLVVRASDSGSEGPEFDSWTGRRLVPLSKKTLYHALLQFTQLLIGYQLKLRNRKGGVAIPTVTL